MPANTMKVHTKVPQHFLGSGNMPSYIPKPKAENRNQLARCSSAPSRTHSKSAAPQLSVGVLCWAAPASAFVALQVEKLLPL